MSALFIKPSALEETSLPAEDRYQHYGIVVSAVQHTWIFFILSTVDNIISAKQKSWSSALQYPWGYSYCQLWNHQHRKVHQHCNILGDINVVSSADDCQQRKSKCHQLRSLGYQQTNVYQHQEVY